MSLSTMELTPSEIKKGQYYTLGEMKLRSYKPPYLFVEVDNEFVVKTFTIFSKTRYECIRIVRSRFNELRAYPII